MPGYLSQLNLNVNCAEDSGIRHTCQLVPSHLLLCCMWITGFGCLTTNAAEDMPLLEQSAKFEDTRLKESADGTGQITQIYILGLYKVRCSNYN